MNKPTALEINACAERLIADSAQILNKRRRVRARQMTLRAKHEAPRNAQQALHFALLAMRYNPRAFALAGLIGQHCG